MTSCIRTLVLAAGLLVAAEAVQAQQPQPLPPATPTTLTAGAASAPTPAGAPVIPLEIQVVVSRWQGDKKVSSLPYTMAVNANEPSGNMSALRMSSRVAVPTTVFQSPAGPGSPQPLTSYQYESVGTNIDCSARSDEDNRFRVFLSVDDSSLMPTTASADLSGPGAPRSAIRSFKSTNNVLLKDGQTRQFTAATDRVTGEVVRIDVTLKVVK